MKKLLVYLLLVFIAWHYYQKNNATTEIVAPPEPAVAEEHDAPVYQEPELISFEPPQAFHVMAANTAAKCVHDLKPSIF